VRLGRRHLVLAGILAGGAVLAGILARPPVYAVDMVRAEIGPLRVTVDEEGVARVREHMEITAPVSGRVAESEVVAGDSVVRGTVVVRLYPAPLDPRTRAQAIAAMEAARSLRREAEARVEQARVALAEARRARARAEHLAPSGAVAVRDLEQAVAEERLRGRDVEAAESHAQAAAQEERRARMSLMGADPLRTGDRALVALRAPIGGRVLRVFEEHDRVVPAGTRLLEIGDPATLEVLVDVLTRDAAEIQPGAPMDVHTGEGPVLRARVKRVEPAAFTKVSPLGVEEQRVNVVGEFLDHPTGLGDQFEVDASIVLWESAHALKIPSGALVPVGNEWGVFAVIDGRARLRRLDLGRRGTREVEVGSGLREGDTVIVHPDDRIREDVRVTPSRRR
jgi:HlyD family secretion protein